MWRVNDGYQKAYTSEGRWGGPNPFTILLWILEHREERHMLVRARSMHNVMLPNTLLMPIRARIEVPTRPTHRCVVPCRHMAIPMPVVPGYPCDVILENRFSWKWVQFESIRSSRVFLLYYKILGRVWLSWIRSYANICGITTLDLMPDLWH